MLKEMIVYLQTTSKEQKKQDRKEFRALRINKRNAYRDLDNALRCITVVDFKAEKWADVHACIWAYDCFDYTLDAYRKFNCHSLGKCQNVGCKYFAAEQKFETAVKAYDDAKIKKSVFWRHKFELAYNKTK